MTELMCIETHRVADIALVIEKGEVVSFIKHQTPTRSHGFDMTIKHPNGRLYVHKKYFAQAYYP